MADPFPHLASAPSDDTSGSDSHSSDSLPRAAAGVGSPPLTPIQIMQAPHLPEDEKEHLLDVLAKAEADGVPITLADASAQLREHDYCRRAVSRLDLTMDATLTADHIEAANHLPEDEREHLWECLEKREALGSRLTADDAHEALEEHREVRRIVRALDANGDGFLTAAEIKNPAVALSDDARQHVLEALHKAVAAGSEALTVDEAHSALEEHREVVAIVRAIESDEGRLTEHNIVAADGISEDEREHLLETLRAIKASGRELTVDLAHQALEEHREVVAVISAIDPGGDGCISVHNLAAADVADGVRACLMRALEVASVRGVQLTTHEAHRVLEGCRCEWAEVMRDGDSSGVDQGMTGGVFAAAFPPQHPWGSAAEMSAAVAPAPAPTRPGPMFTHL